MIELRSGKLRVLVAPLGATLAGLWLDNYPHSLVLGSPDAAAYKAELLYFGALVGPVANRLGHAKLDIAGSPYRVEANENGNCLHSGSDGLHALAWRVLDGSDSSVLLSVDLPDGHGGLPGNRRIAVRYHIVGETRLRLDITAKSDAPTVMNIAHHPYWNLDGAETVEHHSLQVPADYYLPVDAMTLPTGAVAPVAATPLDFRTAHRVPVDRPLDNTLCIARHRRQTPRPCAALRGGNGLTLEISSTEAGLQVYNATGLSGSCARMHPGQSIRPCAGLALEPQGWPDAPNNPDFPSILLDPDAPYRQITDYLFSG